MAMEIMNNSSIYMAQNGMENSGANRTKKKETEKTAETAGSSKSKSTADYMNGLKKLAPSVEFRIGNGLSSAKTGRTLTINPKLLEKMQNDPEKEKEMKELIRGVEKAEKLVNSLESAWGYTCVYRHGYIDENGTFWSCAYVVKEDKLNQKLREESQKNSEKLIERQKEKAAERKEKLQEKLEESRASNKAEQLLHEKITNAKDGMIYLYDTDIRTIIEAAGGEGAGRTDVKRQAAAGANLDLQV